MNNKTRTTAPLLALMLVMAGGPLMVAQAQEPITGAISGTAQAEIIEDVDSLRMDIRPNAGQDVVDTVLAFTNRRATPAAVKCLVRNHRGQIVGDGWTRIAGRGVALLRISSLTNGQAVLGSAQCKAEGPVTGSVVVAADGLSDLTVQQRYDRRSNVTRYHIPLVASF